MQERNDKIRQYSHDYGINLNMKDFVKVLNIKHVKEQQEYKEMRMLKELRLKNSNS